ncbi:hypothetical protein GCM10027570_22550 [Streptomonospora sediminis]
MTEPQEPRVQTAFSGRPAPLLLLTGCVVAAVAAVALGAVLRRTGSASACPGRHRKGRRGRRPRPGARRAPGTSGRLVAGSDMEPFALGAEDA